MTGKPEPAEPAPWARWWAASGDPSVTQGLETIHQRIALAIRERAPRCDLSGRCCDFDRYGHRLYVTALEAAWTLRRVLDEPPEPPAPGSSARPAPLQLPQFPSEAPRPSAQRMWTHAPHPLSPQGPCVFQAQRLCTAHEHRPIGCRLFFCQPGTEDWQQEQHEARLNELKRLHEAHDIPYLYAEWRSLLANARDWLRGQPGPG